MARAQLPGAGAVIEIRLTRALSQDLQLDVDIETSARALALAGPSGAGKSTILNMLAGLERPDAGRIAIGGELLFDSQAGVNLPPQQRGLGYVFQESRLFPHMSVLQNLRFGAGRRNATAEPGFDEIVATLGIARLLERRPAKLSGGEKQRVAIGRALLSGPRALLLDEPLSALDEARRDELIALIARLRDLFMIPMIFVSHRLEEVARLAEAVARVEPGRSVRLEAQKNRPAEAERSI